MAYTTPPKPQKMMLPEMKPKKLIPLSCAKQILAIRKDIEKHVQHKGKQFELVFSAYSEIVVDQGYQKPKPSGCRSGCIHKMNTVLINWLKIFDQQGGVLPAEKEQLNQVREAIMISKGGILVPVETRRAELEQKGWAELKELVGAEKYKELGEGKMVKKEKLIDYLMSI